MASELIVIVDGGKTTVTRSTTDHKLDFEEKTHSVWDTLNLQRL